MDADTILDTAKTVGRELLKDGVIVLYMHLLLRPILVRGLGLLEALGAKLTPGEIEDGEKRAEAEVPKVPQIAAEALRAASKGAGS
jgi:hypothetical protein